MNKPIQFSSLGEIQRLRNGYENRRKLMAQGVDIPIDFGDSDIASEGPSSKIPGAVTTILDPSFQIPEMQTPFDATIKGFDPVAFDRASLVPGNSVLEVILPDLILPLTNLKLRFLRNSKNKGSNGKYLLKWIDESTSIPYYWDGEQTEKGDIILQNLFEREGKQFYRKYPHIAKIKSLKY